MNTKILHFGYIAAMLATIAIAIMLARSWADHVRDDARADAAIAADKAKAEDAKQAIAKIEAERQATVGALQQQIEALKKHPEQAPQVIHDSGIFKESPKIMPDTALPDTPAPQINRGDMVLSLDQQQQLAQFGLSCRQCVADRDAAAAKLGEKDNIIAGKDDELAKQATKLKGGSVWQRFKRRAIPLACSGAGAAAGALADKQKPAVGAMVGAAAANVACLLIGH